MRHPKGFLPIAVVLVAVVVALVVAGASYWYTKDKNEEVVNTNTAVVTNTNTVVNENVNTAVNSNTNAATNVNAVVNGNTNTAADPTVGWKTFTDKDHSYSVKYPSTWTQGGKCAEGDCYGARFADPKDQNIFVEIDYPQQGSDAKRYRDRDWLENVTTYGDQILSTSEESIGAFSVYAKTVKFNRIARTDTMAWFYNNEKIYFFYFSDGERLVRIAGGNIDILRSMIFTFTFLDETAGWKTFTNSIYSLQLKFPNTYQALSNTYGVEDPTLASNFSVRKIATDYSGIPSLEIGTIQLANGESLQEYAEDLFTRNKTKGYTLSELRSSMYGSISAYEFDLQKGFTERDGGTILEGSIGKVVIFSHGGKTFTLLQTGTDSVLARVLASIIFTK